MIADALYAIEMSVVALIAYWSAFFAFAQASSTTSNTIGALWATISAIFVFREHRADSVSAAGSRLLASCFSAALCLIYLLLFPPSLAGMAIVIAVGTVLLLRAQRHGEIATTAITTAVVMVVAVVEPRHAWHQPLLRLADSVIGIVIGTAANWLASFVFERVRS